LKIKTDEIPKVGTNKEYFFKMIGINNGNAIQINAIKINNNSPMKPIFLQKIVENFKIFP